MSGEAKHTEASVLKLLRARHAAKSGNGPEYGYMEKVRNAGSWDATRTADAMALSLWKSRGYELAGFEVKVSRSDWLHELKQPEKAEVWTDVVDRWWVVAPKGVVVLDEVPASWGLMEVTAKCKLVVSKQAPLLTEHRHDIKRSFLVPLLRAAGAGLTATPEQELINAARIEGREEGYKEAGNDAERWKREYKRNEDAAREAQKALREVEEVLGVSLTSWIASENEERTAQVCRALHVALNNEKAIMNARSRLHQTAADLERQAKLLRDHADGATYDMSG